MPVCCAAERTLQCVAAGGFCANTWLSNSATASSLWVRVRPALASSWSPASPRATNRFFQCVTAGGVIAHCAAICPLLCRGPTFIGTQTHAKPQPPKRVLPVRQECEEGGAPPQDRIGHRKMIASEHIEMLIC